LRTLTGGGRSGGGGGYFYVSQTSSSGSSNSSSDDAGSEEDTEDSKVSPAGTPYDEEVVVRGDPNAQKEPSFIGFIKEEGVNILLRTGQAIGGAGQVLLGSAICSGGVTCVAGAVVAAKGADNFQAGIRGTDSVSQQLLIDVTGSEQAGTLINAGLDLGTSVGGLVRSVPKISAYGTAYNPAWYKGVPGYHEPALNQATNTALTVELFSSGSTIYSAVD
ncbi:hypothetical protein, partial [Microbulbifer sp. TYP-18]|uniref:hypothetical protein n=1 Tax=Microbulbifer sp. TYP-18 TaxID=3230024 RepID=UPI0034C68B05